MQKYYVVPQMMGKSEHAGEAVVYFANEVDREFESLRIDRDLNALAAQQAGDDAIKRANERDVLRSTLEALAPDLKVMAILYQQQGNFERAQALMKIRESLGLEK